MVDINAIVNKAEALAKEHQDEVRKAIDAVEDQIDARTGGKYSQQVDQAGNAVEGRLGLPKPSAPAPEQPSEPTPQAPAQEAQAPAPTEHTQAPASTEEAGSAQTADQKATQA